MVEQKSYRTRMAQLARTIMDERKVMYTPLRWVDASAAEFGRVDHHFYQETGEILAAEGFTSLGDRESLAATERRPNVRTFVRGFLSADGMTTVSVAHIRTVQPRLLRWFQKPSVDVRYVAFCTELKKGLFITTNNSKERIQVWTPSFKILQSFRERTPVESMLKAHQACVQMQCEQTNDEPTVARTIQEIDESGERLRAGSYAELAQIGLVDEEKELKKWREQMSGDLAAMLAEEIRKIKAEDAERR